MGRKLTRAMQWARKMCGIMAHVPELKKKPNPHVIKAILMRSSRSAFTKKGPGVSARRRAAVSELTLAQLKVAAKKGWLR